MNFLEAVAAAGELPELQVTILHEPTGCHFFMSADGTIGSGDDNVDGYPHFSCFADNCWVVETVPC